MVIFIDRCLSLGVSFLSPCFSPRALLALLNGAVRGTELIEFSELCHTPWLDALRATRGGGLLLGHVFLWSDVVCVALGATLAAGAELAWRSVGRRSRSAAAR